MKNTSIKLSAIALGTAAALVSVQAHAGKDLDNIKKRGEIICGVNTGLAGFSDRKSVV